MHFAQNKQKNLYKTEKYHIYVEKYSKVRYYKNTKTIKNFNKADRVRSEKEQSRFCANKKEDLL